MTNITVPLKDRKNRILLVWLSIIFTALFCIRFFIDSTAAILNVFDGIFFLPALIIITKDLIDHRTLTARDLALICPLAVFLLWAAISMLWADTPNPSRTLRAIFQIILFTIFLIWAAKKHEKILTISFTVGALSLAVTTTIATIIFYLNNPINYPIEFTKNKIPGYASIQLLVTIMIAPFAAFTLIAQAYASPRRSLVTLYTVGAIAIIAFIILTQRRTGFVAIGAGLATAAILTRNKALLTALTALGVITAFLLYIDINEFASRGSTHRLSTWAYYIEKSTESFFFGEGLVHRESGLVFKTNEGRTVSVSHIHNIFLSIYYYLGATGFTLFCIAWAYPLYLSWKMRKLNTSNAFYLLPILPSLCVLFFDGGYPVLPIEPNWFGLWLPLAFLIILSIKPSRPPESIE